MQIPVDDLEMFFTSHPERIFSEEYKCALKLLGTDDAAKIGIMGRLACNQHGLFNLFDAAIIPLRLFDNNEIYALVSKGF